MSLKCNLNSVGRGGGSVSGKVKLKDSNAGEGVGGDQRGISDQM